MYQKNDLPCMLLVGLLISTAAFAKSPVRHMQPSTLGIEYAATFRGQTITKANHNSQARLQLLTLSYAPIEYVQFALGAGGARFLVDEYKMTKFEGNYGFAPVFGIDLNTPALINEVLRVTAGFDFLYFRSRDDFQWEYVGTQLTPSAGLLFHAGRYLDLEFGAMGHILFGSAKETDGSDSGNFANDTYVRGYAEVTLTSPSGAFGQFRFDASPEADSDLSNGPIESTLGFSVGLLLTPDRKNKRLLDKNSKYFPAYSDMKKKMREMEEEIE